MSLPNEQLIERATSGIVEMHQPACPKCRHEPLEFACNVVHRLPNIPADAPPA